MFRKISPHAVEVMFVLMVDEVKEDDDETIAILTEHEGLKTRFKDNKAF